VRQDVLYQDFSIELEQIMLSEIAYTGFEADRLFFSGREVVEQIKTFLARNLNAPRHLDGEKILDTIAMQQGVLVERATDVYSFSHLTLQEYLTAQYIADNNEIEQLVNEHLTDQRWREVFMLVAGLVRSRNGADDLLLLMEKAVQKYINTPKLEGLLLWADEVTAGSDGNYKGCGKRAVAIANANAFDIANTNANVRVRANAIVIATPTSSLTPMSSPTSTPTSSPTPPPSPSPNASKLERLKIFKDVNWTELINQLKVLETQIPSDNEPEEVHERFINHFCSNLAKCPSISLEN
jgi:hypothetical protein